MRKSKTTIIIALFLGLLFMGVGYAVLSTSLELSGSNTVQGNWNVKIKNITATSKSQSAVSRNVTFDDNSASFAVDLYEAGDYVEYTVTVKNEGNINAVLQNVTSNITNQSEYISMTNSLETGNRIGETLSVGQTMTFTVRIAVNGQEEDLVDSTGSVYNITLRFVQN